MTTVLRPVDVVVAALERHDCRPRRSGNRWDARCPAHDDRHASLSVSEGAHDKVLVRCHRAEGCSINAIADALGLPLSAFFAPKPTTNGSGPEWGGSTIVATYDYTSEDGVVLFQTVRRNPKGFAQRRPSRQGDPPARVKDGWVWNLNGTRRVPYQLPRVVKAVEAGETIYVVEGEKKVHALKRLGLPATCNPMGAGKWLDEYSDYLRGAGRTVILVDCDKPGRDHGGQVAASACAVGVDDVRLLDLDPQRTNGYDIADWLAHAKTDEERAQARKLLEELVEKTERFVRPPRDDPGRTKNPGGDEAQTLPIRPLREALEHVAEEPYWLLRFYIALGWLMLLAGIPKAGKSTLLAALIAAINRGCLFLGCETKAARVVLLTEEPREALKQKLIQFGIDADATHVVFLDEARRIGSSWPEIVRDAVTYCRSHDAQLLVIDTLDKWCGLRGDAENSAGAVIEAAEPLLLAARGGLAVVLLTHQRKSGGEYGEGVRGSNALVGAADVVVEIERLPSSFGADENVRALRAVSRFPSTPEELLCELVDDGYVVRGTRDDVRGELDDKNILGVLSKEPLKETEIREELEAAEIAIAKTTLYKRLENLVSRGLVGEARRRRQTRPPSVPSAT